MYAKKIRCRNMIDLLCIVLFTLFGSRGYSESTIATTEITLRGNAEGGILTLVEMPSLNSRYVSVATKSAEPAESVATRLAAIINNSNPFEWAGTYEVGVEGSSLTLPGEQGMYAFAGTETGLGIPQPPTSLSGSYDVEHGQIVLNWQNPGAGFDRIFIADYGFPFPVYAPVSGTEEKYVCKRGNTKRTFAYYCIVGVRDGVPSSPAAIRVTGNAQEELFGIPFYNGVAPNWQPWAHNIDPTVAKGLIKERTVENLAAAKGRPFNPVKTADAKPFKQILKTPASGGTLGIWRKFLNLNSAHTYMLTARLNTLDMDPADPNWSISLHAVADGATWKNPTASQFANPGSDIPTLRWNEASTNGEYVDKSMPVRLADGADSIIVWLRLESKKAAEAAFDYIKLEDAGATD